MNKTLVQHLIFIAVCSAEVCSGIIGNMFVGLCAGAIGILLAGWLLTEKKP